MVVAPLEPCHCQTTQHFVVDPIMRSPLVAKKNKWVQKVLLTNMVYDIPVSSTSGLGEGRGRLLTTYSFLKHQLRLSTFISQAGGLKEKEHKWKQEEN